MSALEFSSWQSQLRRVDTPEAPPRAASAPAHDDVPLAPSPYLRPTPRAANTVEPVVVVPDEVADVRRVPIGVVAGLTIAGLALVALIAVFAGPWLRSGGPRALLARVGAARAVVAARPTPPERVAPLPAPYERLARGPLNVGVTYFATMSRHGDDAHLADVLTRAVISRLRRARDREGGPVTASFVAPAPTANFTYSVTGSVGRDGDRVRCQVRVAASDGTIIWQDDLTRPLVELERLADDVSARVAARLAARLPVAAPHAAGSGAQRTAVSPDSAEGYDRLLRGRYLRGRYDAASLEAAAEAYVLSARLNPRSPAAHAELAATYARLARWNGPRGAYMTLGRDAARRALALDSGAALAWAAGAALAAQDARLDRAAVVAWARRAAAADRTSPEGDRALALLHLRTGDLGAAEAAFRRVLQRHPDDADAMSELAELHRRAGRLREARALVDRAVATDPNAIPAYAIRALVRARYAGGMRAAFADAEVATQLGRPLWGDAVRAQLQAAARDREGAEATVRQVVARARASEAPLSAWDERFVDAAVAATEPRGGRRPGGPLARPRPG